MEFKGDRYLTRKLQHGRQLTVGAPWPQPYDTRSFGRDSTGVRVGSCLANHCSKLITANCQVDFSSQH